MVEFNPPDFECPVCGHPMVHIDRVDFFGSEPGRVVTVTAPEEDSDKFPEVRWARPNVGEQPSTRRHAIRLWIDCEEGHLLSLTLNQHKGATLVDQRLESDSDLLSGAVSE